MKKIRFTEERVLLDNSRVNIGDEREFDDDEAAAFVNNGVAEFVATAKPTKEVAANG